MYEIGQSRRKKNSGGGKLDKARLLCLYGEPLGMSAKREAAPLSHLPKTVNKFQKWGPCDHICKSRET